MQTIKLNNGIEMPVLGYGVFQVSPEECERCVLDAISTGYRLIDTAQAYYNEEGVGNAVTRCGVPRNELFLTTKIWISNAGETKAARSIDESLRKLHTDYIDFATHPSAFQRLPGNMAGHGEGRKRWKSPCHRPFQLLPRPLCGYGGICRNQTCRELVKDECVQPAVGGRSRNESL